MRTFKPFYLAILAFCLVSIPAIYAQEPDEIGAVIRTGWELDAEAETELFIPLTAYGPSFDRVTDFNLGFARFRPRGYDWRYREQRLGNTLFTDWFRGAPAWNAVSGLTGTGTERHERFTPHSVGRSADREILPWQLRRGGRLGVSGANRNYNFRGTATYHSGENQDNGWAYTLFASRSWGDRLPAEGTWNDSWGFSGGVSKKIGHNRIGLHLLYAPTQRALAPASTAEAYALTGNNLYNPQWGYYAGKVRAVNVRTSRQPVAILTHEVTPGDHLRITTSASARFGQEKYTALNWQNAPNPRPDYYRHMPSFQTSEAMRERVTELWQSDPSVSQVDWQSIVDLNRYNTPRANYILESRVRDYLEYTFRSTAEWNIADFTLLRGGIELLGADNQNFKRVEDLLGGEYWLDVDVFAENDDDRPNGTQSDLRNPNRRVTEGGEFGYKYSMQNLTGRLWAELSHRKGPWSYYAAASAGQARYRRFGYYEKENFPGDASFGYSDWLTHTEYFVQGGVSYNMGGRLRVGVTATAQSLAPIPHNSFISPEYRNATVPDLKNERILASELRVDYNTPGFRFYAAGFWTEFRDKTEAHRFYEDFNYYFCNYLLQGINTRHAGIELSVGVQLGNYVWLHAAGTLMDNRYTSDPQATEQRESTGETVLTERVYYSGLKVPGSPQKAGVLKIEYTPRSWTFSLAANGFGRHFISPAPLRRTLRSTDQAASPEELEQMVTQERLPGGVTLDFFAGRTVWFSSGRSMGIYTGVSNLFDRRNLRTGGYEAYRMRFSGSEPNRRLRPLDSRYYYATGINFYITANFRF